jgi:hypothetical protein
MAKTCERRAMPEKAEKRIRNREFFYMAVVSSLDMQGSPE